MFPTFAMLLMLRISLKKKLMVNEGTELRILLIGAEIITSGSLQ